MLTGQLRLTAGAHETLLMPRLVSIGHTPFSQGLFTACASWGELVLIAGNTVVFILVRDEGLGANGLFAAVTDEAALMPCRACIFQLPCTWHDDLVTGYALGRELVTVAVVAEQSIILAGKWFICQRAVAAETAKAVLVVVSVLIKQLPCIMADKFFALVARV